MVGGPRTCQLEVDASVAVVTGHGFEDRFECARVCSDEVGSVEEHLGITAGDLRRLGRERQPVLRAVEQPGVNLGAGLVPKVFELGGNEFTP